MAVVPFAGFEAFAGRDGEVVVRVRGEIDMAAAPVFRERLTAVIESNGDDVVIDLADVSFMDSSGLVVLVEAHQKLESASRKLLIARPSPAVTRVLEVTGLDRLFGEPG
jgi:anti-sigma B factor antagonist